MYKINDYDVDPLEADNADVSWEADPPKPVANASKSPICWQWFEEDDLPDFNWTVNKLGICPGPITILNGFSNVGKTFFAANLAISVANGFNLFDNIKVENPGNVLHIDWDQGQKFSQIYYWRMLNGYKLKSFNGIDYYRPEWHLQDKEALSLIELLSKYRLCIIDCLGSAIPQADINEDKVRSYIDMLNDISEQSNCSIVLLHHEPKDTSGRDLLKSVKGNGSIISAAGCSIHLTRQKNGSICYELGKKRLIKNMKGYYLLEDCGEYSKKLGIENGIILTPVPGDEEPDIQSQLLECIKNNPGISTTELKKSVPGNDTDKINSIKLLITQGSITTKGEKPCKHYLKENDDGI